MSVVVNHGQIPPNIQIITNVYKLFIEWTLTDRNAVLAELSKPVLEVTAMACGVSMEVIKEVCAGFSITQTSVKEEIVDSVEMDVEMDAQVDAMVDIKPKIEPDSTNMRLEPVMSSDPCIFVTQIVHDTNINDKLMHDFRRIVHQFYDNGEYPMLPKVHKAFMSKAGFILSRSTTKQLLSTLNFNFRKISNGHKFLTEHYTTMDMRYRFLNKMNSLRTGSNRRPIVYLDETWLNPSLNKNSLWRNSLEIKDFEAPLPKGGRLVIAHAGSNKLGLIPKACFHLTMNQIKTDTGSMAGACEREDKALLMSPKVFIDWFTKLCKLLQEPCVIVMDDAPYHWVPLVKLPDRNAVKSELHDFLTEKNIPFTNSQSMTELRHLIEANVPGGKLYEVEEVAERFNHELVRLPNFHSRFNPIEYAFAHIKELVLNKRGTDQVKDVKSDFYEAMGLFTFEDWKNCERKAEEWQEKDFKTEKKRVKMLEPVHLSFIDETNYSSDSNGNGN